MLPLFPAIVKFCSTNRLLTLQITTKAIHYVSPVLLLSVLYLLWFFLSTILYFLNSSSDLWFSFSYIFPLFSLSFSFHFPFSLLLFCSFFLSSFLCVRIFVYLPFFSLYYHVLALSDPFVIFTSVCLSYMFAFALHFHNPSHSCCFLFHSFSLPLSSHCLFIWLIIFQIYFLVLFFLSLI